MLWSFYAQLLSQVLLLNCAVISSGNGTYNPWFLWYFLRTGTNLHKILFFLVFSQTDKCVLYMFFFDLQTLFYFIWPLEVHSGLRCWLRLVIQPSQIHYWPCLWHWASHFAFLLCQAVPTFTIYRTNDLLVWFTHEIKSTVKPKIKIALCGSSR
jgi:hypothetical protein